MVNRVVSKELAGIEDLLLGSGIVNQTRSGNTVPMTKIDAAGLIYENAETLRTRFGKKVEVLINVAALQALATTTAAETFVYLLGYTTAGDGGGGLFWLDSSDTITVEDLNIVFNPDVVANGRWKRVDTDNYMSPDRGDADYTIQAFDFGIQLYNTALTADRTVTLPITGLYKGKKVTVVNKILSDTFNIIVGTYTIKVPGKLELVFDGSTWKALKDPAEREINLLNTKKLDIGDWDMVATTNISVAHGLDGTKIESVSVWIRDDTDTQHYPLDYPDITGSYVPAGSFFSNTTNIVLYRNAGLAFNDIAFDSTSYNRGWIIIQYTD